MKLYVDIKAGQFECHGTIELGIKMTSRTLNVDALFESPDIYLIYNYANRNRTRQSFNS